MSPIKSARIARMLSLAAAVAFVPGCVIESHGGVDQPSSGCASLQGSGSSGLISLSSARGYYYSLESYSYPGYYVRHANGRGMISYVADDLDADDATFRIVPGLADSRCISFESRNYLDTYLRQEDGAIYLDDFSSDSHFQQDATFCPRAGLADSSELSFEACSYPGEYLNLAGDDLLYVSGGSGWVYEEDATFSLVDPWSP